MVNKEFNKDNLDSYSREELTSLIATLSDNYQVLTNQINEYDKTINNLKETIDSQNETIDNQKEAIAEQNKAIAEQKETISDQKSVIKNQNSTIEHLKELLALANCEKYKPQTESMQYLFPEMEAILQYKVEDENIEEVQKIVKIKKRRKTCLTLPPSTPVVVKDYTENAPETKIVEGVEYIRGDNQVFFKLSHVPSRNVLYKEIRATWVMKEEADEGEQKKIIGFGNKELDSLSADASMVAHIAVSKFDDHIPLYRQEEIFKRDGLNLSRQTMCNWLQAYYTSLTGFEMFLTQELFKSNLINQDETPVDVISVTDNGGKKSSNCFVIIRVGTTFDKDTGGYHRIVQLSFSIGRSKEALFDGFNGYKGFLLTDGLKGYLSTDFFEQNRHAVCWVHAVRKLKKYIQLNPKDNNVKKLLSLHGELYTIEDECREKLNNKEITPEEFLSLRKDKAKVVIDEIFKIVEVNYKDYLKKDTLREGLDYLITYKPNLYTYLDNVECTPDNNECERRAKAFATGRKNWLFCESINGADASCFFYTLIETAKEYGLNPERYLEYVLRFGPTTPKEDYASLLPWNVDMSIIDNLVDERARAKADSTRTEPYVLSGFSR